MSYLALARKWRPRTFSQLVGQDHVSKPLINSLNQQRLHHAYLFTGTRGVGKTSIARILAKSLNCEQGITSEPCLQCTACLSIEQGRFIDLLEIDGASKTRVEDTREVLDNVQYSPTVGRFKIYLIDEVHMLSQHSFNALLKTLEEPPEHVKFILATTDPIKLPVTVLSRCLQFNLKHLSIELISQQLQLILRNEQFEFEVLAADILAKAAKGSMRDALSLLDQAISGCDEKLTANHVKMILGYTQQDYALQLLNALIESNASKLLQISQKISIEGGHFQYVLDELLCYLHQIAVYQLIEGDNPLISLSSEIKPLAHSVTAEDIQLFYQIGLKGREEIHLAPALAIGFNMTMLRMLTFQPSPKVSISHIDSYNMNLSLPTQSGTNEPILSSENETQQTHLTSDSESYSSNSFDYSSTRQKQNDEISFDKEESATWSCIIPCLKLSGLALNAAENAEFISKEGREIKLRVSKGHKSLFTPNVLSKLENSLAKYYHGPVKIILNIDESTLSSPAQQKEQEIKKRKENAEISLQSDPVFQHIQQEFSAELVKNSIVPLKDGL